MNNLVTAIGVTFSIVISLVLLIAIVYVSVWLVLASAVVLMFYFIYTMLSAKDDLVNHS